MCFILRHKAITAAMIAAGTTIAEPAAGETLWVSGGTYAVDELRIRAETHRVYSCVQAHTGRTALPEADPLYWKDIGPTQRWAPFDVYTSTAATTVTSMTYVLEPGFINSLALYGLTGTAVSVSIKDAPGGTTIYTYSQPLYVPSSGLYEYLFGVRRPINKLLLSGLPLRPTAEITITVTAGTGDPVGVGMINVGDLQPLIHASAAWGGTRYGATAEPITFSYIKFNEDGTSTIKRRGSATNMSITVVMPRTAADAAIRSIQQVLDVPVSWIGVNASGYDGLNTFGLGSGRLSYDSYGHAIFTITVKGFI